LRLEAWNQDHKVSTYQAQRNRHCYELCFGTQFPAFVVNVNVIFNRPEFDSPGCDGIVVFGYRCDCGSEFCDYGSQGARDWVAEPANGASK